MYVNRRFYILIIVLFIYISLCVFRSCDPFTCFTQQFPLFFFLSFQLFSLSQHHYPPPPPPPPAHILTPTQPCGLYSVPFIYLFYPKVSFILFFSLFGLSAFPSITTTSSHLPPPPLFHPHTLNQAGSSQFPLFISSNANLQFH